eukprot:SAG31_NODE_34469_length_332_cov_1.321888_1_plen_65_part_10
MTYRNRPLRYVTHVSYLNTGLGTQGQGQALGHSLALLSKVPKSVSPPIKLLYHQLASVKFRMELG